MASISSVITGGFGTPGSAALVITDGYGTAGTTPTPVAEVSTASGVKRSRRRRYVIELDGQPVVVGSIAEAQELLAAVKEQLQDKVAAVVAAPKPITIKAGKAVPRVVARTPDKAIRRVVADAQRDYDRIVKQAIARAIAEEDELIVLLGV